MATERKVTEIIKEAGYEPLEDRAIIVTYVPRNLSEKITRFLKYLKSGNWHRKNLDATLDTLKTRKYA